MKRKKFGRIIARIFLILFAVLKAPYVLMPHSIDGAYANYWTGDEMKCVYLPSGEGAVVHYCGVPV